MLLFPALDARTSWTRRRCLRRLAALLILSGLIQPAAAVTIQFDFSYDATSFFGTAAAPTPARKTLEFAGRTYSPFTDSLAAIEPGGNDTWTASFNNPSTGALASLNNLVLPQDTIIVYAGAYDLPGAALGLSGPGAHSLPASGPSAAFRGAVVNRGQGLEQDDFAPWGGFISFDTTTSGGAPRLWSFDYNAPAIPGTYDFYTVAVHELAHMMGFGLSTAFNADVNPTLPEFDGPAAASLYGAGVPLSAERQHFASSVTSPPFAPGTQPKPSLGPSLAQAERKTLTPLDYAVMQDIGWQVPPQLLGLPGDVDGDNDVDGADFVLWQRNVGGFGGAPGDVNGDLVVDDYDGWIVRRFLGSVGAPAGGAAKVPEPMNLFLSAVALITVTIRRRPLRLVVIRNPIRTIS
jgi:hypothetical protein